MEVGMKRQIGVATGPRPLSAALASGAATGTIGGEPPSEILLFPAPTWQLADMTLTIDELSRKAIVAEFKRRGVDIVIDYDHQSLTAQESGNPALASGWITGLRADKDGVWGTGVRWTEKAAAMIRAGEYRYFSPVCYFDQSTGRVMALESVALTNTPRTNNQSPLTARAAASLIEQFRKEREEEMKWFQLLKASMGRAANTAPADMAADLKKVVDALEADGAEPASSDAKVTLAASIGFAGAEVPSEVLSILGLEQGAPIAKVQASLLTLVARSDYDKLVAKVTELQGKLDASSKTSEIDKLVAVNRTKLSPALERQVRAIAATSIDSAKSIVAELPVLVAGSTTAAAAEPNTPAADEGNTVVELPEGDFRVAEPNSAAVAASTRAIMKEKGIGYSAANEVRKQREAEAEATV
jgi:phage I-like protein